MKVPAARLTISGTRWLMPPLLAKPQFSWPGPAWARARSSATLRAGTAGFTTRARGCCALRASGATSRKVGDHSLLSIAGLITTVPVLAISRV